MKKQTVSLAASLILFIAACKKEDQKNATGSSQSTQYASLSDFYDKNGAALQVYTIDASAGGSFTSPQGTTVTIAPHSFRTLAGVNVTGNVTILFKDIYKTSDMLLSNKPTIMVTGSPLKSGGEFFIKALQNEEPLQLDSTVIIVEQPVVNTAGFDSADVGMQPFVGIQNMDSMGNNNFMWQEWPASNVVTQISDYVFSMYHFNTPEDSGTWCNSDNPTYFSAYPLTSLTLHPVNAEASTDVFLIFQGLNSMIHVYHNWNDSNYTYSYAPLLLNCTAVAVSVKDGKLLSSFTPISISNNLVIDFTLTETTTEQFKETLRALD